MSLGGGIGHAHACVGICCPLHERCARYAWVNGSCESSSSWLPFCALPGADLYPGFIHIDFIGPPARGQVNNVYEIQAEGYATL